MSKATTSQLFLLTSEWEDTRNGHLLRYYGQSAEHGAVELTFSDQPPVFFVKRKTKLPKLTGLNHQRAVELKNFGGEAVDALYFNSYRNARAAGDILRAAGTPPYESDVRPDRRFLMERFIFSMIEATGEATRQGNLLRFLNPTIRAIEVAPLFRVASIDIETGDKNRVIYSIATHLSGADGNEESIFIVGEEPDVPEEGIVFLPDERSMIKAFFDWFNKTDPDFIIGWNVIGFDLMMIEKRCKQLHINFSLGRSKRPASLRKNEFSGFQASVSGRVVIDGPQALRASFYNFEDFRLSTVAHELIGEEKLIGADTDRVAEIERLFKTDKLALARYNIQDCRLVTRIFDAVDLLPLYARRSQISGMLPGEIGRSVAAFDHYMLPLLHRRGLVAPDKQDVHGNEHAAGGYVMEPQPGIYKNVAVLDFKSLYPSIIRTFCIDPFSRLMGDQDTLETPQGFRFSRTQHILPDVIRRLLEQRSVAKEENDKALSQAVKILMNSFYGVMGSFGCRFYHPDLPSAITSTGQWLLKGCRTYLEERGFRVLYGDTDSVFVLLPEVLSESPEKVASGLADELNTYWSNTMAARGLESHLEMEFEKVYSTFVLPLARGREGGARK
ncbi:MAG: DNA polymerase II, partial [Calditrichia bacterium]